MREGETRQNKEKEGETRLITIGSHEISQVEAMEEDWVEDMELRELDLDAIERECEKACEGYVTQEQVALLQKAIIRSKASQDMGISVE